VALVLGEVDLGGVDLREEYPVLVFGLLLRVILIHVHHFQVDTFLIVGELNWKVLALFEVGVV
jgi:hypothetical protein